MHFFFFGKKIFRKEKSDKFWRILYGSAISRSCDEKARAAWTRSDLINRIDSQKVSGSPKWLHSVLKVQKVAEIPKYGISPQSWIKLFYLGSGTS